MNSRYCLNCGHEEHDGPLYKEVMDGDNKPIRIEICRSCRVKNDSYGYINKVIETDPLGQEQFYQVDMFGDTENNDKEQFQGMYTEELIDYIADYMPAPLTEHPETIGAVGNWYDQKISVTYGGLDYVHAGHGAKTFRKAVQSFCNEIKRVAPAGSASFELAKDFMDKHYGEEGK